MIKTQVDLVSRTGTTSKTSCVFSANANCLFEAGNNSKNIAILPRPEMSEYITGNESKRDILNRGLHRGFQSNLNESVSCLTLMETEPGKELLFVGGNNALEIFEFSNSLEFTKIFHAKEEVFSLKGVAQGALIVGRGKYEKKMIKGKTALIVFLPKTDLNAEEKFRMKKTKTPFYCMFNTSISGLVTKDSQLLVIGVHNQERNSFCIENLDTGNFFKVRAHTMTIYALAIDPLSRFMVTGGWDKSLVLWTPKTPLEELESSKTNSQIEKRFFKEEKRNSNFHSSWINHVQIVCKAPNLTNTFVITGGFDHHVKILSLNRFETLYDFNFMVKVFDCEMFENKLWIVGDEPDRLVMVSGINLMGKQIKNLKNNLRSFLGNKYVDSMIKVNRDKKEAQLKMQKEEQLVKYQVLLEESEHTINQLELQKERSDERIQSLLNKISELENKNRELSRRVKDHCESEKVAKEKVNQIGELVRKLKSEPAKSDHYISLILEKLE